MTTAPKASLKRSHYLLFAVLGLAVVLGLYSWLKYIAFKKEREVDSQFLLYQLERLYIGAQNSYRNQNGIFAKELTVLCREGLIVKDMCSSDLDSPHFLPYCGYGFRIVLFEVSSLPDAEKLGYKSEVAHGISHALFAVPVGKFSAERDTYVVFGSGKNFRTRLTAQTSSVKIFDPGMVDDSWIVEELIEVPPRFQVAPELPRGASTKDISEKLEEKPQSPQPPPAPK